VLSVVQPRGHVVRQRRASTAELDEGDFARRDRSVRAADAHRESGAAVIDQLPADALARSENDRRSLLRAGG